MLPVYRATVGRRSSSLNLSSIIYVKKRLYDRFFDNFTDFECLDNASTSFHSTFFFLHLILFVTVYDIWICGYMGLYDISISLSVAFWCWCLHSVLWIFISSRLTKLFFVYFKRGKCKFCWIHVEDFKDFWELFKS